MHAPCFVSEMLADVFGIRSDFSSQLEPSRLQHLRVWERVSRIICRSNNRIRFCHTTCRFPACAKKEPRSTQPFFNMIIRTKRTLHQATLFLALKIILRSKPALKDMTKAALKIKHFHSVAGALVHLPTTAQKIPIHESRKCQCDEHGAGDGIKLPLLGRDLPRAVLKQKRDSTYQEI